MKKKAKQIWLLMTTLILIILGSCDNRRKIHHIIKSIISMRKNYQWSILKGFTQKSIMNFSKIMKKKTIKPSGTGKEDKPLLLSNEYNPFEIAPREINIGNRL